MQNKICHNNSKCGISTICEQFVYSRHDGLSQSRKKHSTANFEINFGLEKTRA